MKETRKLVARGFSETFQIELEPAGRDPEEQTAAFTLEREKYATDTWIHQHTEVPDTTGAAVLGTPGGLVDVRVALAGRTIKAAYFRGDFFESEGALADLEGRLRWHSSDRGAIAATVAAWARERSEGTLQPDAIARAVAAAAADALAADGGGDPAREPYGCFVNPGASRA